MGVVLLDTMWFNGVMTTTYHFPVLSPGQVVTVKDFGTVTVSTVGRRYFTGVRLSDGALLRSTGLGLAHPVVAS